MTRLFWVRHGPTHQKVFTGWRDVPADLSDTAALQRLAASLPAQAAVVSSDLIRAVATADAVQGTRLRLPHDPALREINFGAWDGLHHTEVSARDPDLARRYWDEPGDLAPPMGESWNAVSERVAQATDRLMRDNPDRDLIIVAHMGVIMTQIARASGQSPQQAMGHQIAPLSITEIQAGPRWQVSRINHIA